MGNLTKEQMLNNFTNCYPVSCRDNTEWDTIIEEPLQFVRTMPAENPYEAIYSEREGDYKSFDDNNTMYFSGKRKKAFIEHYQLQLLYVERESETEFYVAPNGAVVEFCVDQLTVTGVYFETDMIDIDKLFKAPEVLVDYDSLLEDLFGHNIKLAKRIDYEAVKPSLVLLRDTPITKPLRYFVKSQYKNIVKKCEKAKKPVLSNLYCCKKCFNNFNFMKVQGLNNTTVELTRFFSDSTEDITVPLETFFNVYRTVTDSEMEDLVMIIMKLFYYVFNDDLMIGITNGEPVESGVGLQYYSFRDGIGIQAINITENNVSFCLELDDETFLVSLYKNKSKFNKKTSGTILELPYILNLYNKTHDESLKEALIKRIDNYADLTTRIVERFFDMFAGYTNITDILDLASKRLFTVVDAVKRLKEKDRCISE